MAAATAHHTGGSATARGGWCFIAVHTGRHFKYSHPPISRADPDVSLVILGFCSSGVLLVSRFASRRRNGRPRHQRWGIYSLLHTIEIHPIAAAGAPAPPSGRHPGDVAAAGPPPLPTSTLASTSPPALAHQLSSDRRGPTAPHRTVLTTRLCRRSSLLPPVLPLLRPPMTTAPRNSDPKVRPPRLEEEDE